jgi:hypothetical protein
MSKTRLDIETRLAKQVEDVITAHREAGETVTKTQVVSQAISLYGDINTPDLKLNAYVRYHYPLDDLASDVERWYTDFVDATT